VKETLKTIGLVCLALLWHWKTIAFYLFMIGAFILMLFDQGILAAFAVIPVCYFLKFIGKFL